MQVKIYKIYLNRKNNVKILLKAKNWTGRIFSWEEIQRQIGK